MSIHVDLSKLPSNEAYEQALKLLNEEALDDYLSGRSKEDTEAFEADAAGVLAALVQDDIDRAVERLAGP